MELKRYTYTVTLIALIVLENLFLFYFYGHNITNQTVNAFGFFFSSLLIGIVLFLKFYKTKAEQTAIVLTVPVKKKILLLLFYTALITFLNVLTIQIIKTYPIDFNYSDIIPSIELMAKSFLAHKDPYGYETYSQLGYHNPSGYLTAHWWPYCIAEYFSFDYRTMSFIIWCLGAILLLIRSMKLKDIRLQIVIPFLLVLSYSLMAKQQGDIIGETVEIIIAGYYMLLIAGINQKNAIVTGIFVSLCLLSRYVIVLWLPLCALVMLTSGHKKELRKIVLVTLVLVIVLYVIPFMSHDWKNFYVAHKEHETAIAEWKHGDAQGRPIHLYRGVGFAYLFYEHYSDTNATLTYGHQLITNILYIMLILFLTLSGIWFWFNKNKIHYKIFLLVSLKIYLTILYSFIHTPYLYIIVTGNFVSIAIFAEQARYKIFKIDNPSINTAET